jgi:molecular chaperone Hsp33
MADSFLPAVWHEHGIILGVACTSALCGTAQQLHQGSPGQTVALSRLLTCAALLRFITPRSGSLSLQTVSGGSIKQVYADITATGELRGYCRGVAPATVENATDYHLRPAPLLGAGTLSVIRSQSTTQFSQSSVALCGSEIDTDVRHYAEQSEQVPTVLSCIEVAPATYGGFIAQGLPGANLEVLAALHQIATPKLLTKLFSETPQDPAAILTGLAPRVEQKPPQPLAWKCRCSQERACAAAALLGPAELAQMVKQEETATIHCEFCGQAFHVTPEELSKLIIAL